VAKLPHCTIRTKTNLPEKGHVKIAVEEADKPFTLRVRMPRWACEGEKSHYIVYENVKEGDVFEYDLPMSFKITKYSGGEEIIGKDRYAVEYGPLLYAAMGAPNPVEMNWDPAEPEKWLKPMENRLGFTVEGDDQHEYWPYVDIFDEPFSVYPVFPQK